MSDLPESLFLNPVWHSLCTALTGIWPTSSGETRYERNPMRACVPSAVEGKEDVKAGGRNLGGSQRFHGTMVIQARTGGTLRAAGAQQRDASGP